jgi:fructose-bisphosphate aldolase class II
MHHPNGLVQFPNSIILRGGRVPLVDTGQLVARARTAGVGVAAFNVITLEHAEAIVAAAERTRLPVVLQVSENAARFHGSLAPITAASVSVATASTVEVALHLDHVTDTSLLYQAAEAGYSSAMFDAADLSYDANVAATRAAAAWAHEHGLWLEAELGYVGGKAEAPVSAHAPGARTEPRQAVAFVAATGVDALAVAVGSTHAMTQRTARLDLGLVTELREAVGVPLVLHGSSGVPDDQLRAGVRAGLTKINVGTALNVAYTGAVRAALGADDALVDPRRYLREARAAMTDTAAALLGVIAG